MNLRHSEKIIKLKEEKLNEMIREQEKNAHKIKAEERKESKH